MVPNFVNLRTFMLFCVVMGIQWNFLHRVERHDVQHIRIREVLLSIFLIVIIAS